METEGDGTYGGMTPEIRDRLGSIPHPVTKTVAAPILVLE